jgi:uncharacterized protein YjiS (DUF1127 family)
VNVALQYERTQTYLYDAPDIGRAPEGAWIMGLFSGLINSRQRAADRRYAEHLAILQSMSARDRADIGLNLGQIETVARHMAKK